MNEDFDKQKAEVGMADEKTDENLTDENKDDDEEENPRFAMKLSLNVLEHLGINLYSNVPSVLSEVVANAWDADAENVHVSFDKDTDTIIIQDDGHGMVEDDVNERFLRVGYRRRESQPGLTAKGRAPMGRKGIGKLSLFAIANDIKVETIKNGERSAFSMKLVDMRRAISEEDTTYNPTELDTDSIDFVKGTRITLKNLKRRQTISTPDQLRTRLARRFSIIGPKNDFEVHVDEEAIKPSDRGYFDKIDLLWTYGDQEDVKNQSENAIEITDRTAAVNKHDIEITGWLGTVKESGQLKDGDNSENLNRIAIFVRGKMAQEDVLQDFTERGVYASYLIGELHVEGLDTYNGDPEDKDDDAATSSRQKMVEDDPRYISAKKAIYDELKHIQSSWSKLREKEGVKQARTIPAVASWLDDLKGEQKRRANRWLGKINKIQTDEDTERKQLYKHAILAFEFHRWNESLDLLDTIDENNMTAVVGLFQDLDSLETNLYGQLVKSRVQILQTLRDRVDENAKERVIQEFLFDHLWLLDPAWERVEASEQMETRVETMIKDADSTLTEEERKGRIDIQYRKTAGKHVIVELKRPKVKVSAHDLAKQVGKYLSGLKKILTDAGKSEEPIEVVCVLGVAPREHEQPDGAQKVVNILSTEQARWVHYDTLLDNSYQAYQDYTKNKTKVDRLSAIISGIDDFSE